MCDSAMADYVVVSTTVDSEVAGKELAEKIVNSRLAACVQRMPISSTYWWKGAVESAEEQLLLCKTATAVSHKLMTFIQQEHSYEVPEIIVTPIVDGGHDYLHWISHETKPTA
jgi:periplasmic divalent cation tolerance protein